MNKKVLYYLPLFLLLSMSFVDAYGFIIREKSPVYWRAWEYVSNYKGKDANFAPFKPMSKFDRIVNGDLLNAIEFTPTNDEKRRQEFVVDEYGFRNQPGFLDGQVDAVIIGSSFVGGGMETQSNLISTILTQKYGIRTYNYFSSLQNFWEDSRFKDKQVKYVILVGSEGELISSLWRYNIEIRTPLYTYKKWSSYTEWKSENETLPQKYEQWAEELKQFSLCRYLAIQTKLYLMNSLYSRDQIAKQTTQSVVTYYPENGMMYWQEDYDVPYLNSAGKTRKDIEVAVQNYLDVQKKLKEKRMKLILVAMPSKTHAQMKKYHSIPAESRALYVLNQEFEKNRLTYVDAYTPFLFFSQYFNINFYYADDSHWNSLTNKFLSYEISKKIEAIEHETKK